MNEQFSVLARENVASIRDVQKNPSKALRGITRVIRGSKTIGFFLSNEEWEDLLENIEAMSSPSFRARVRSARRQMKEGKTVPLAEILKKYGIRT